MNSKPRIFGPLINVSEDFVYRYFLFLGIPFYLGKEATTNYISSLKKIHNKPESEN